MITEILSEAIKNKITEIENFNQGKRIDLNEAASEKSIENHYNPGKRIEQSKENKGDIKTDTSSGSEKIRIEKIETNLHEEKIKNGGSYGELKREYEGIENIEIHHIPADSAYDIKRNDGPAIAMDKYEHRQTASWGSSKDAQEYRKTQENLIKNGKFEEAMQMDIDDIHDKFGNKYDDAISEACKYSKSIIKMENIYG